MDSFVPAPTLAQQFLDLSKIRAHVKKVGRVTMPQSMGMDPVHDPYALRARFENPADVPNAEANQLAISQA